MEQRIALTQGANVKHYIIDDVIGFGASCLVYKAHFLDNANHKKEVILKECYPYYAGTTRIGNKIVWSNADERDAAFLRFRQAYDIASEIQNTANAKSVSAYSLEILPENGTQYVITIPDGDSYDKIKSDDIADIVRTALALTNTIGLYHRAGYLHLDIKPSNFIATADQTGQGKNIVLFDVDTVVSIEDIQSGKLRGVSYSKEYAAPEQKQQKVKKLCPATDLYAVGAVLFERIMNRRADCTDACMFAEWEFDSRFDIKNVKPKAKRLLTEIFHKTLAANIKRRYQSADELAAALEALRKVICEPAPYISSYPLNTTCHFVGRRDDLAQLHHALADSRLVFVQGAGGIGKTELVRKYISIHQDEYDAVVFMLYNGSVSDCLNDIEIIGVDSEDKNKKTLLREICDNDKVLLILDNYDVAPNESKGLDELLDLNCKVIVTTRTDFSERNPNARFIEVAGLSAKALCVIFENESDCTLTDSEFCKLESILYIGKQCTYFWSMIARLAKEGAYTVSEIVEKVSAGLDDLAESEDVFDTKDGSFINTTVAAAMLVLFKLDELGDNEFEVLNELYFLDCLNMDKRQIKEMLAFSEIKLMNSFNTLVKKGYIQRLTVASREVYRISNVLRNVLEYREELDISESGSVTAFIEKKLFWVKESPSTDVTIQQKRINDAILCLFKIFSGIKWRVSNNALYCINKLYDLLVGERFTELIHNDLADTVMLYVEACLVRSDFEQIIKLKIYTILITWCSISLSGLIMIADALNNEMLEELIGEIIGLIKKIEVLFNTAISETERCAINESVIVDNICRPVISGIRMFRVCNFFSVDTIKKIISINPLCLQNEEKDILQSFRVLCLRNNEYEKIYLRDTLKRIENAKDKDKEKTAYLSVGFIALNGSGVDLQIDNELRNLRKAVLGFCRNMLFDSSSNGKLCLKSVDSLDFSPDCISLDKNVCFLTMEEGVRLFYQSTLLSNKTIEKERDKYSIDDLLASIFSIDSSDGLYDCLTKFWNIVNIKCNDELEPHEKKKYINAAKELAKRLKEIYDQGNFTKVFVDDPLLDYYLDYPKMEVALNTATAIMYDKIGDYDKTYTYAELVIRYSKYCLDKMREEDRKDFPNNKNFEKFFIILINALSENGDTKMLVTLLYNYIRLLRDTLNITDEADERLLGYYRTLVGFAKLSKEMCEKPDYYITIGVKTTDNNPCSLFTTAQDYDDLIEKYTKLIEQISGQKYHPEIE